MEEIINYAINTPENTNPNILRSMLQTASNSSSGGVAFVTVSYDEATDTEYIDKSYNELVNLVLVEKKLVVCLNVWYETGEEPTQVYVYMLGDFGHDYENEIYSVAFYRLDSSEFSVVWYATDPDAPMQSGLPNLEPGNLEPAAPVETGEQP